MQLTAVTLAAACLLTIAWQDFVSRRVWVYCFALLAIAGALSMFDGVRETGRMSWYVGCNLGFLVAQLALLKLYFLIRRRPGAVIDQMIGWGDILFLAAAAFFFSPVNFISFYLYSLILSLLVSLIWMRFRPTVAKRIPLAGLQAIALLLVIGAGRYWHWTLWSDEWVIGKIMPL